MELRSGFVPPFPGTHALFLTNEELEALKTLVATSHFHRESNVDIATTIGEVLGSPYASKWRL